MARGGLADHRGCRRVQAPLSVVFVVVGARKDQGDSAGWGTVWRVRVKVPRAGHGGQQDGVAGAPGFVSVVWPGTAADGLNQCKCIWVVVDARESSASRPARRRMSSDRGLQAR
eukprot:4219312-Lingulodinium_polyedra.AAC.2